MRRSRVLIVVMVFAVLTWGALALAKPPGGGGGGSHENCRFVPCAACPEGYVLATPVWPDCCVCVPAP